MEKEKVTVAADATIRRCKCNHEFQDKTYGSKMRVMTPGTKNYSCTVCNTKHEFKS